MFKKSVAEKEKVKLMLALTGPSGAGKTYSALQLAYGIAGDWSKIAVADTENKSALYYAGKTTGPWQHIEFSSAMPKGYHPNNWIKLIEFAESDPNIEVLILDSISHEWQACLQLIEQFSKTGAGNSYVQWAKVTPLHNAFIDKMRNSRLHIIATIRSVTEYVLEVNDKGKQAPKKMGMKGKQRDDLDYEFGIIFDIDISHYATSSKDRTSLFLDRAPFKITHDLGKELNDWAKDGHEIRKNLANVILNTPNPLHVVPSQPVKALEIFDAENVEHVRSADSFLGAGEKHLHDIVCGIMHGKEKSRKNLMESIMEAKRKEITLEL